MSNCAYFSFFFGNKCDAQTLTFSIPFLSKIHCISMSAISTDVHTDVVLVTFSHTLCRPPNNRRFLMAKSRNGLTAAAFLILGTSLVLVAFSTKNWIVTDGKLENPKFDRIGKLAVSRHPA